MERAVFFDRLKQSRLLSEAQVQQASHRFQNDLPSEAIAEALVEEGVLTAFQVRHVCAGDTQPLSLGQYRLLDEVGRGGMGFVYKALHTIMGRVVALKVIAKELVSDPVAVEWFCREVRASTQLNHPNIVMAYDANEAEGLHFLVMEYVHGVTLDALVKQYGPLPTAHTCALMRQAALGLQHAHEKGMVHRDIKPGNLIIPYPEGEQPPEVLVKILDFGLARLQGTSKGDTIALRGENGVLGTPDYIAPEQSRDIHAADIRSDLYSLGCAFYFSLAGRVPFPGDNAMEKLVKHLMEQPEPLEKIRADVPLAVAAIVRRLMAKDPADRYQTPAQLVQDLECWAAEKPCILSAAKTANRPLWIAPPTRLPAHGPGTDTNSSDTRMLSAIEVFAPSRRVEESSGPSLLGVVEQFPLQESCPPDSRDTVTLSKAEETEVATSDIRLESESPAPTPTSGPLPPIDPVVCRLWQRWMELVAMIVEGRGAGRVNAENYRTIHTMLLQACRAAIEAAEIPERRAFYEECLSIAQPWLKLQSFTVTERTFLQSLLRRGQELDFELNHDGKAPRPPHQFFGMVLITFSPIAAAMWYWNYGRLWLPSLYRAFNGELTLASLSSAGTFLRAHPPLLMGLIFPVAFLFSLSLLSRTPRS